MEAVSIGFQPRWGRSVGQRRTLLRTLRAAEQLGEELQKLIGSKVTLDYDNGKGRIVIHFYSDDELNQVADTLRDSWRN